uniref:Splicing factor, arginine/serine-rich 18 n=1 Tax=Magallana gigas TaxID=29159 RepID=A0A8W8JDW4_MAGGI
MWANPWGGGGPIQQSAFQGMPNDQVDWAALAKQWIAQRETVAEHPPAMPIGGAPPPPPPPANGGPGGDDMDIEGDNENNSQDSNSYDYNSQGWGWNGAPNWNVNMAAGWGVNLGEGSKNPQSFDYSHQGNFPPAFDYNHGGDQFNFQGSGGDYNQYWEGQDNTPTPPGTEDENSGLDAAKRKTLPAWIREGLEKMEREKQKKMERERIEQEKKEAEKREQAEKEAMDDMTNDGEPHVPKKSRFDSDDEEDQSSLPPTPVKDRSRSPEQVKRRSPSPQEFKSEEEKQMEFMMKVRKMLTEILLDVTNSEIKSVCKEVYLKEKSRASKAPAKQLTKSTALASLTGLGLTGYGSDSDEEEEEEEEPDSDEDLEERIRQKKEAFERKIKEAGIYDEDELEPEAPKIFKDPISDKHSYPFQNKYNGIPGLDVKSEPESSSKDSKGKTERPAEKTKKAKKSRPTSSSSSSASGSSSESDSDSSK